MKVFVGVKDNDWVAFLSQQSGSNNEFDNGEYYYTFHGKRLHVHAHRQYQPSPVIFHSRVPH